MFELESRQIFTSQKWNICTLKCSKSVSQRGEVRKIKSTWCESRGFHRRQWLLAPSLFDIFAFISTSFFLWFSFNENFSTRGTTALTQSRSMMVSVCVSGKYFHSSEAILAWKIEKIRKIEWNFASLWPRRFREVFLLFALVMNFFFGNVRCASFQMFWFVKKRRFCVGLLIFFFCCCYYAPAARFGFDSARRKQENELAGPRTCFVIAIWASGVLISRSWNRFFFQSNWFVMPTTFHFFGNDEKIETNWLIGKLSLIE